MIKNIVMQQYKGDGEYDILHPETDSSMITDFETAAKDVLVVNMTIDDEGVVCDHPINTIYDAYNKANCIIAKVLDERTNKTPVSVNNYIAQLFMAKQDDVTVGSTTYHTNSITFNVFKDNVAVRFLGTCTFQDESEPEDIQDIWSWNLANNIYEEKANMTQEVVASSKANQYPSAKAVYHAIGHVVQMTELTKIVDGADTLCNYPVTDSLPHYAILDDITTATCTIYPMVAFDNYNEHRVLVINNNQSTLGAQISPDVNPIGGATTAYSIPVGGMVELVFRRISMTSILAYYNFVNETNI